MMTGKAHRPMMQHDKEHDDMEANIAAKLLALQRRKSKNGGK